MYVLEEVAAVDITAHDSPVSIGVQSRGFGDTYYIVKSIQTVVE